MGDPHSINFGGHTLADGTHEQAFVADVSSWINSILERATNLPFKNARVEEHPQGKRTRRDLSIYDKDGRVALSGEVKMPDAKDGKSPYDENVVQDAFLKASQTGARFFFTWNVNRLVIFDPSKVSLPILQRQTKDYRWFTLTKSVEVRSPDAEFKLRNEYLPNLLQDLAALYRGETPFGVLPPDERFIMMLESFLERPVELTRQETYRRWHEDNAFKKDLSTWMVNSQKWTIPKNEFDLADLLDRASKLACYILANKLIFYEALRHRFPLTPITIPKTVDSVDRLYGRLAHFFEEAQKVTEDYQTIFWPDYGAKLPLFAPGAIDAWKSVTDQIALFKLGSLQYDVLGPIFQRLIDKDSKHKYGQHYTQPTIVDVINAFTIRRADAVVLDPGCGSGTFLIRAYARKRWLDPTMDHPTAMSQLSTAVTVVHPCADAEQRNSNKVKFVQLRVPIADMLENDGTEDGGQRAAEQFRDTVLKTDQDTSTEQYRILVRTQSELYQQGIPDTEQAESLSADEEEDSGTGEQHVIHSVRTEFRYVGSKWGVFLRAPDLYFQLMGRFQGRFAALSSIADIAVGVCWTSKPPRTSVA
jgi:hypothetical protein